MSGKDFSKFSKKEENLADDIDKRVETIDPNIYVSAAVGQEIREKQQYLMNSQILQTILMTPLVAPLQTIYVSLQLSVLAHKNIYGQEKKLSDSKALLEQPRALTLQDRRKYELLVRSGVSGSNQPFQAPVYGGYQEVWKGLSGQGWQGFYKGALSGLIHNLLTQYFKFTLLDHFNNERFTLYNRSKKEVIFIAQSLQLLSVDFFTYPMQVVQSRFILQNRNENFSVYQRIEALFQSFKLRPWKLWAGCMVVVPHAFLLNKGYDWCNKRLQKGSGMSFCISHLSSTLCTYPLSTVMRRLQCQSDTPGMLRPRYSGAFHCFVLTFQEEGLKGLYRGISAALLHQTLVSLFMFRAIIQTNKQFLHQY